MKTSDEGVDKIEKREGVRFVAYKDVKGIWTIGVGHTGPEVKEGLVWNAEQVKQALESDLKTAEDAINELVKVTLTQYQFDALVSFVFNVGVGAFEKSTMLKYINQGDFEGAALQFDRWNIPSSIIGRRNTERDQFKGK
jgi:lysozyme